jgi:hypothetical protein
MVKADCLNPSHGGFLLWLTGEKKGSMPVSGAAWRFALSVQNSRRNQPTRSGKMTYGRPKDEPRVLRNQGMAYSL